MISTIEWFQQILSTRFAVFLNEESEYSSVYDIPDCDSPWLETVTGHAGLTFEERVVVLTALMPHVYPQALDLFFLHNQELNRPYTEFGGNACLSSGGFVPTGETVAFILAGNDPVRRIEVMSYLRKQHWFYMEDVLCLNEEKGELPLMARRLSVSNRVLEKIFDPRVSKELLSRKVELNKGINIHEARKSPCLECSALCCKLLVLENFMLNTLSELEKIAYYLNFSDISVILSVNGVVSVYYSRICQYFNDKDHTCRIHNCPEQPSICVHYNPYNCFYRRADTDRMQIRDGNIWLNAERLKVLSDMLRFDTQRKIINVAPVQQLIQALNQVPYREVQRNDMTDIVLEHPSAVIDGCAECEGLCCKNLYFPMPLAQKEESLDFMYYSLGFPGVQYLINDNSWVMKVEARCRHLHGEVKCGVYGKTERPLMCRYKDPCRCETKSFLNSANWLVVQKDNFSSFRQAIKVESDGSIRAVPSIDYLRKIIV